RAPAGSPALDRASEAGRARSGSFTRIAVATVAAVVGGGKEREVRGDALLLHADAVADEVRDVVGAAGHADDQVGDVVVRAPAVRPARVVGRRHAGART